MGENFVPNTAAKEEEAFAESVNIAREDAGMFGGKDAIPEEDKAPQQQRADGASAPPQRDEQGRFTRTEAPAEPFEGFSKLDAKAQEYIRGAMSDKERLQQDVIREQNRAREAQQRLSQVRPTPRRNQPTPPAATTKPPATAPQPRDLPGWKKVADEFPEFHKSLEERIAATEGDLGRKLTAIEEAQAKLDQQLQEVSEVSHRFEAREERERRASARERLNEIAPNWEILAGWKDREGNPIPPDRQAFVPELRAWLDAHPTDVRQLLERQLADPRPEIIGKVFADFNRDLAEIMGVQAGAGSNNGGSNATPPVSNLTQRRNVALNDTQPRPGTGGPPRGGTDPGGGMNRPDAAYSREEAEFAATAADSAALRRWRGQR
jgi:hypothetical protein